MAVTSIHAINATLNKAIDYILNEDKTDGGMLVSTLCCTADGKKAEQDFDEVRKQGTGMTTTLAKHLIQSFLPDEVTPEQAHEIGLKLCEKLLGNSYQYVLATHIDKGHIHNHIIFNEVDFINYRSFEYQENRGGKIFEKIQKISDKLCTEYGLNVIKNPELGKGKSHYEWEMDKLGKSWKTQLRNEIDQTIMESDNFDDFLTKLRAKDIEVVYRPENTVKIKFRLPEQERFARGKTLGWYYDAPQIERRIEQCYLLRTGQKLTHKKSKLIDTSQDKFRQSKGLERWAEIKNMQEVSKLLNILTEYNLNSREELENRSIERYGNRVEIVGKLNNLQRKIDSIGDTIKVLRTYLKYKPLDDEYKRVTFKRKFAKDNEKELRRYDSAKQELLKRFPDRKLPRIETLYDEQASLINQRNSLNQEYKKIVAELEQLDYARQTICEYLDKSEKQMKQKKEIE